MSIIHEETNYVVISHMNYLNSLYGNVDTDDKIFTFCCKNEFFNILEPYKATKLAKHASYRLDTEAAIILNRYNKIKLSVVHCFNQSCAIDSEHNARKAAEDFYAFAIKLNNNVKGGNTSPDNICATIEGQQYLIPRLCRFYNYDVANLTQHVTEKFDLVLLDPPWWNKSIRKKRSWNEKEGYSMLWNQDLAAIPLRTILKDDALVAVWCTNAPSHIEAIINDIFPQWGLTVVTTWFWLKVTLKGEPITPFAPMNCKQPYERIIFGTVNSGRTIPLPEANKLIISVPSAIHSHKPPLADLLQRYLPERPQCLEIFARYLLPSWTSYGNEVLKLQHTSLFTKS